MWLIGLLIFWLFYRVYIVWWWGARLKNRLEKPYYWDMKWYQSLLAIIGAVLLLSAMAFFWATSPWLAIVPVVLVPFALFHVESQKNRRMGRAIGTAMMINRRLEQAGVSRLVINKEIAAALLKPERLQSWGAVDTDLRSLLKFHLLPELGLYSFESDVAAMYANNPKAMMGTHIDKAMDSFETLVNNPVSIQK